MSHVDPELLAGHAAGEDDALAAAEADHLSACVPCAETLDDLRRVVELAPDAVADELVDPAPRVWRRVVDAIDRPLAPGSDQARPDQGPLGLRPVADPGGRFLDDPATDGPISDGPGPVESRWGARRIGAMLAAALIGALAGVTAAQLGSGSPSAEGRVLSSTLLTALPGHRGSGTAELVLADDHRSVRIRVDSAVPSAEHRELWLIHTDGRRMLSLGVLPADGAGSYPLPPTLLGDLDGFTTVDVSLEPEDGNPLHSRNSQVRGTLPV